MQVADYATLDALWCEICAEAAHPARFPARFILLSGVAHWTALIRRLEEHCETIRLSSLCNGDSIPSLFEVIERLDQAAHGSALVIPLGEILRLYPGSREPYLDYLFSLDSPGLGRLYVPIIDHGGLVRFSADRHPHYAAYSPPVWRLSSEGVAIAEFAPLMIRSERARVVEGFQAYLRAWESGSLTSALVITHLAPRLSENDGVLSTRVYRNGFDVVRRYLVEGGQLEGGWGSESQWAWLAKEVILGEGLAALAGRLLNVLGYDERQLYAMWQGRNNDGRWLTWLWTKVHSLGDSVPGMAALASASPEEMGQAVAMVPFDGEMSLECIASRRHLLAVLGVSEMPAAFWARLEALTEPMDRLTALPGLAQTCQERIVIEVARLIREDIPMERWLPIISVTFPELAAYLSAPPVDDPELGHYLRCYALSRICDEPSEVLRNHVETWATSRRAWAVRTRAARMHDLRVEDAHTVWVDGLGVEWLGMLYQTLTARGLAVDARFGRCRLPSVTSANADWIEGTEVDRELDQMAHSYSYSYPRSFVRQLRFVARLCEQLATQCEAQHRVVLTSDHGLTRFAAHGKPVELPEGYRSHKWGRHAEPVSRLAPSSPDGEWLVEDDQLVLARYGLFRGGSRSTGEVHGGATPEECLVPIVCVRLRGDQPPPRIMLPATTVRLDARGSGQLTVTVSAHLDWLRLMIGSASFHGTQHDEHTWQVSLHGISAGKHSVQFHSELGRLGTADIEIVRGIEKRDLGL